MRTWFLYVIECEDGSLYTGISVDVHKRYAQHCRGKGARYTRSHLPRVLLGYCPFSDRSSASKAEYAFKQLSPAQKRAHLVDWKKAYAGILPLSAPSSV